MVETQQARRSQAERRSASEEALLDAAAELVAELGTVRASFPRIGDRAGTSRGLPSHHFGSKDALVGRLARRTQERIRSAVTRVLDSAEPRDGLEAVRQTMDAYLALFEDPTPETRALLVMWGATFTTEGSLPAMHEADRRTYEGWLEAVRTGQADGSIRDELPPEDTASALLAISRGFAALLLADADVIGPNARATCDHWITTVMASHGHHDSATTNHTKE